MLYETGYCLCMNVIDYKVCICVLNQTAHVAKHVHAYERMMFVHVTHVSDMFNIELVAGLYRISNP